MVNNFYKDQKLHLLEDPSIQMTVFRVEDDSITVHKWLDDYKYVNERYTDVEGTKKLVGEGW
jgi:hypothetical protein